MAPPFPVFETGRLVLREVTLADAGWYLQHFSDPRIVQGQGYPGPADLDAAGAEVQEYCIDLFAKGSGIRWGLCLRGTNELCGSAGFYEWVRTPRQQVELGYDLAPSHQGRGLMTEALGEILRFGADELGIERFVATILTHNGPSCRVLDRLSFTYQGVLPQHGPDEHGVLRDEYPYVLER